MTSIDLRVHCRSTNQQGLKVMAKPIKMLDLVTLLVNCFAQHKSVTFVYVHFGYLCMHFRYH